MAKVDRCKVCGKELPKRRSRAELVELIAEAMYDLDRDDPPHPLPPSVGDSWEAYSRHREEWRFYQRARACARLAIVTNREIERICVECAIARRDRAYEAARAAGSHGEKPE